MLPNVANFCYTGKHPFTGAEHYYAWVDRRSREVLAVNIKRLMTEKGWRQPELARRSGLPQRTISNLLNPAAQGPKGPQLDSIERVARGLGVATWKLLMNGISVDMLNSSKLEELIVNYAKSDDRGREDTFRVAEIAARYGPKN